AISSHPLYPSVSSVFSSLPFSFSCHATAPTQAYTLSLHDALPISANVPPHKQAKELASGKDRMAMLSLAFKNEKAVEVSDIEQRSEEHTSELQSRFDLVCRLLLEKKNCTYNYNSL